MVSFLKIGPPLPQFGPRVGLKLGAGLSLRRRWLARPLSCHRDALDGLPAANLALPLPTDRCANHKQLATKRSNEAAPFGAEWLKLSPKRLAQKWSGGCERRIGN